MNILLINPPWYRLQGASLVHYPPGPTYIAAALEQDGYNPIVWNVDFDPEVKTVIGGTNILDTDELVKQHNLYKKNLNDLNAPIWEEVKAHLSEFKPDVLGLSAYSATYKSALNVAKIAKQINPKTVTIFGGIHPTIAPNDVASQEQVDFVVCGEGEITIQELIKAIKEKKDFSEVKGLVFKTNGHIHKTSDRERIEDLDQLPKPARHLIYKKEKYPPAAFQGIYGSRGCPYKCIFCGSFNVWGYKLRTRSAENLVQEIEDTQRTYGTRYFYLCDDIFFMKRERALKFCQLILDKKLDIYWSAQTRAELVDDELLDMMKKSGGQHVAIGVETGDENIRKLIKKGNTLEDMRRAAKMVHAHGLTMVGFFMFGFPWETKEDIDRTVKFMKELDPTVAFPYIVTPAPGTELSEIAQQMGLIDPGASLEDFYHESPEMCLSVNIPLEERKTIINNTLEIFANHNKSHFVRDIFRRPRFYYSLLHDYNMIKHPKFLLNYIVEAVTSK